ncbi:MAG: amidase [Rhodospirillaceae bacterium]|nr:amidase [Rhodospirillaceae bacterium]
MSEELTRLSARAAVRLLEAGEVTPLDLIDAALDRIAAVEPDVNALPTLSAERARDRAKRLMANPGMRPGDGRGWLAGLPVAIKDLMDVEGVRSTQGSPIFADHVPDRSHPLVERIEAHGGIVLAKSNTPEFGAGGNTFNEVFGTTLNPWNTELTCGGSSGGSAVALATGEIWLAHGSDHGGSLRKPAAFCSVVGLRPSPGRVTRGAVSNMFNPSSVQGPMARDVPDLALFLDTMAGRDPLDPMTQPAPERSYLDTVEAALAGGPEGRPLRVAWAPDLNSGIPVSREIRDVCADAARRFEDLGATVEEACPDLGRIGEAFEILRALIFVVDRSPMLETHREMLKPDIIWNTEKGLALTASEIAWAERERAAFVRRIVAFFEEYDLLLCPTTITPPFDASLRYVEEVDGKRFDNYMAAALITSAVTLSSCPALSVPAGFTTDGLPVGLQVVGKPRDEAGLLASAARFEQASGLAKLLPIDPKGAR